MLQILFFEYFRFLQCTWYGFTNYFVSILVYFRQSHDPAYLHSEDVFSIGFLYVIKEKRFNMVLIKIIHFHRGVRKKKRYKSASARNNWLMFYRQLSDLNVIILCNCTYQQYQWSCALSILSLFPSGSLFPNYDRLQYARARASIMSLLFQAARVRTESPLNKHTT